MIELRQRLSGCCVCVRGQHANAGHEDKGVRNVEASI